MALYEGIEYDISADMPCGPDPEADLDFQNFLAVAEGQLPASYRAFDKKAFDAKPTLARLKAELEKTRDLRLLVLAAKYHILSDDLAGLADAIVAAQTLLSKQWDHCHPAEAAGGAPVRSAYLQSLDDLPTVVLPLQNASLVVDKRFGTITMRQILIANGKLPAPSEEPVLGAADINDALSRFEPLETLATLRGRLAEIQSSLASIRQLFIEKAGYEVAPDFERLADMIGSIFGYIAPVVAARQPVTEVLTVSTPSAQDEPTPPVETVAVEKGAAAIVLPGNIASVQEASNALSAILDYYGRNEPSSPARLLLQQAHQLVGKSFLEAMKILAPALVEKVSVQIGGTAPFALNFAQLDALPSDGTSANDDPSARTYDVKTRPEATALLQQIEQFYRSSEPSSPIPMLIDKARNMVAKDFTTLLREITQRDEKP